MSAGSKSGGYLLDTHTAIWALESPELLTAAGRNAVLAGPNVLSVLSYWEVTLKSMKGKLDVGDPRIWWLEALDQLAATPLVLRPQHIAGVSELPPIHRDPFDRMLVAQAIVEGLTLVSIDEEIAQYTVSGLHFIG